MKSLLLSCALSCCAIPFLVSTAAAAPTTAEAAPKAAPETLLADQVSEIAAATNVPEATRKKLITNAVRLAVTAEVDGIKDPTQIVQNAAQMIVAATRAAPNYAEVILRAGASVPVVSGIDGSLAELRSMVAEALTETSESGPDLGSPGGTPAAPNTQFGGNLSSVVVSPSH